jgi:hypothetical protein
MVVVHFDVDRAGAVDGHQETLAASSLALHWSRRSHYPSHDARIGSTRYPAPASNAIIQQATLCCLALGCASGHLGGSFHLFRQPRPLPPLALPTRVERRSDEHLKNRAAQDDADDQMQHVYGPNEGSSYYKAANLSAGILSALIQVLVFGPIPPDPLRIQADLEALYAWDRVDGMVRSSFFHRCVALAPACRRGLPLVECCRPNVMEHRKRHVTHVTFSALHHFHVDAKCVRILSRKECVTLFKTIDEHLKGRNPGGSVSCYNFAFGRKFSFWHPYLRSACVR